MWTVKGGAGESCVVCLGEGRGGGVSGYDAECGVGITCKQVMLDANSCMKGRSIGNIILYLRIYKPTHAHRHARARANG